MTSLQIRLFGDLNIRHGRQVLAAPDLGKAKDVLCYLLLNRGRPHRREALAEMFWGGSRGSQPRKYLRQALWQLQGALGVRSEPHCSRLLLVDADWVRVNQQADHWLDVEVLERVFSRLEGLPDGALSDEQASSLEHAVGLYRGDLLEACADDWCELERERLRDVYLALVDKLMGYCQATQRYETGLTHGARALRFDRVRERTHQRIMRLHYLAGDRAAALRQFERCASLLRDDLDVEPSRETLQLYERIRLDRLDASQGAPLERESGVMPLYDLLGDLKAIRTALADVERHIEHDIAAVESALDERP